MAKKETAEEKLKMLLKSTEKVASSVDVAIATGSVSQKSSGFSLTLQKTNWVLMLVALCCLAFFIYEMRDGLMLLGNRVTFSADGHIASKENVTIPRMRSMSYYQGQMERRDIFKPYVKSEINTENVTSGQAILAQKMSKYKIVGIAWLDLPESATVMLEDTGTGLTRYFKEGDKIDDVTVKIIYTDRVVFGYENEEITIKL